MATVPMDQRPHAVDPPFLVSWNNKQAPGWAAADDKFDYGPVFRSQMIEARVKQAIAGSRKATLQQLVQAMEEPASQDLEAWALMPILRKALGTPTSAKLRDAIALLSRWAASGAHRRDLNKDGKDEDEAAITLMDAWWPRLTDAEFGPTLGGDALTALKTMVRPASVLPGDDPAAPDYDDGWFSYVDKDLRDVFTPSSVRGPWSRRYCGGGSASLCRKRLQNSLLAALNVSAKDIYGKGDCADTPTAACFDQNRSTIASGIDMPPAPFQNRPTFQQTAEPTRRLPR
jgi:Penicillin amidase